MLCVVLRDYRDFEDRETNQHRKAGQEWLFVGPGTYRPQVEVQVLDTVRAIILKPDQALKLQARDDCIDYETHKRKAGEEWLVRKEGAYLPQVNEKVVETLKAYILTDKKALHVRAKSTFVDAENVEHKAGTEWLVTNRTTEAYIPGVYEEVTREVDLIVLTKNSYCIIKDPIDNNGKPQLGVRKLVKGEQAFFLRPGESLETEEGTIRKAIILAPDDGLWLTASEEFMDTHAGRQVKRRPGDVWLCTGPGQYWTPIEAKIQRRVKAFLRVEPLALFFFQPALFFSSVFAVIFAFYILSKYVFGAKQHDL